MTSKTNEKALECAIEKALTGICKEAAADFTVAESEAPYGGNGYYAGNAKDFDARFALDTRRFWHFLETTQKEELVKLQKSSDWKLKILERLDRMIKKQGILQILRKGLDVDDAHFELLYQPPLASSSEVVKKNFASNEFSITRQVHYNLNKPAESIDMVLFINGLAIATLELKNPWTGQTARVHGQRQYKFDRDISQTLLHFGRCLVHFTMDTDEVYMTTRLNGGDTFFLPFNRGYRHGKGNPPHPFGHKSSYLWEEILTRERLANIIQHYVRFDGKGTDSLSSRTLYFPRYHQLDVVRRIIEHTSKNGVGETYLIQHSAGSGKSNSITWAAYQMIEIYPESETTPGAKGIDQPLFDSVIVVTDRRLLDKQIRENIKDFSEVKNIVAPAYSSRELRENLQAGKKIIITTIQKFPFIVEGIDDLSEKRFAVVIDEAHSSQSGTAASKMNQAIGAGEIGGAEEEDGYVDTQEIVLNAMRSSKMKSNASYLAFTATPKNSTLERFGQREEDGSFRPFHLYSMKQAIEEGFILDVLANYTTYRSYYEIQKSVTENPLFSKSKAQMKLRAFVERDPRTIATKAEIMLDHFLQSVYGPRKLKGKAKAMVVTQNIESAIRYYKELKKLLREKGDLFKIAIAFSGKKMVDGVEYTEPEINGFGEKETRDKFDGDDYRILVVANKYLTGFDQPKLSTMYVDKKLQGVLAVQALSRLNRSANKYGKKTEDLFILDFFNKVEEIREAFDPFYTSTILSEATDVNVLHELKDYLDEPGVYEWHEVEDFVEKFFRKVDAQELSPIIDVAAARFTDELELEETQKVDFKIKAKQFVKIYGQMAAILPYEMITWEKLFWFLKFLIPKLIVKTRDDEQIHELLESVDLSTYGLERTRLNYSITLDETESQLDPQNPNPRGAHDGEDEKDFLTEIVNTFNEKWFHGWEETPENQKVKFIRLCDAIRNHPDFTEKYAENTDLQNRDIAFNKMLEDVMAKQRKSEFELYRLYATDDAFTKALRHLLKLMTDSDISSP